MIVKHIIIHVFVVAICDLKLIRLVFLPMRFEMYCVSFYFPYSCL